ncbi:MULTISPECIES: DUF4192 domain-containing protein [Prauserella salsuginis group]|uniref:DUF4192 domain-containing protein n=1 Tax=Prauserella salsuginis TaxID=387889 RepID=A0ABW6G880_9PSEU|nr:MULTISPECIES: DUF4192 domain-containing protein [Prauserella salsuginis group]
MSTSSTTNPEFGTRVDLRSPEQLLAALPYLLGFTPADSLVLLAHAPDGPEADTVGHVMRVDIPDVAAVPELEPPLRVPLADAAAVTVVLVGGIAPDEGPAHRDVMRALTAVMTDLGVPINHALWASEIRLGARWCCYGDEMCGGELPDPTASTMAAVTTHAGQLTYASREAMEGALDPEGAAVLARRAALLDLAASRDETDPACRDEEIENACALVGDVLARFRSGVGGTGPVLSDREIVELARALTHHEVRDASFGVCWPPRSDLAVAAERLWTVLVRGVPAPERAEAASLLAYTAYLRGDGPLAGVAVRKALESHPGHTLAQLLDRALAHAVPPETLAGLARNRGRHLALRAGGSGAPGATRGPGGAGP